LAMPKKDQGKTMASTQNLAAAVADKAMIEMLQKLVQKNLDGPKEKKKKKKVRKPTKAAQSRSEMRDDTLRSGMCFGSETYIRQRLAAHRASKSTKPFLGFSAAPLSKGGRGGLRAHFYFPMVNVAVAASTAVNGNILQLPDGTPTNRVAVDPTISTIWLNAFVPALCGCFAKYAVRAMTLVYKEVGGIATERAPMYIGFVDDEAHPVNTSTTVAKILNLSNQQDFNAWEEWEMKLDIDSSLENYSTNSSSDTSDSAKRMQTCGSIVGASGFASTPAVLYGVLWADAIVDLYDPAPIFTTLTASPIDPSDYKEFIEWRRMRDRRNLRAALPLPARRAHDSDDDEKTSIISDYEVARRVVPAMPAGPPGGLKPVPKGL